MSISIEFNQRSDVWGAVASALCLVHCLASPFLFVAHTGHVHGHHSHPFWWGLLDVLFIIISFLAVFWSVKNTSRNWMKYALWTSWALLTASILNEKLQLVPLAEAFTYIPSIALVALHLYNRKYCKCREEDCCSNTKKYVPNGD